MPQNNTLTNVEVTAREVDFVTSFERDWQHLLDILGILRPIKMSPGTVLRSKYAEVTLTKDQVGKGEEIQASTAEIKEKEYAEVKVEKYMTKVPVEDIAKYGYDNACVLSDEAFKNELQQDVTDRFYAYLNKGMLKGSQKTWQRCLSIAKGAVLNKYKKMHKRITKTIGFVNVMDLYDYLGDQPITTQTVFGFQYIQNFLGYDTIFLLSDAEIAQGTVIATPANNINLYYVDPGESDFAKAGLEYTVSGETNLIGYHVEGDYDTASSKSYALMGLELFAEYIDGVCVVTKGSENTNPEAVNEDETGN